MAWNTGPLTKRQYYAAVERYNYIHHHQRHINFHTLRYEWNKSQRYQSIVAMVYLTWNMARNIRVCDPELFIAMKTTLMCSLRQSVLMRQYALENDIPIRCLRRYKYRFISAPFIQIKFHHFPSEKYPFISITC